LQTIPKNKFIHRVSVAPDIKKIQNYDFKDVTAEELKESMEVPSHNSSGEITKYTFEMAL
jgi:hypothetical protein